MAKTPKQEIEIVEFQSDNNGLQEYLEDKINQGYYIDKMISYGTLGNKFVVMLIPVDQ